MGHYPQKHSGGLNLSDAELVHFNQAMQIFAVLGRRHKLRERSEEVLARLPAPACLCDGAGRILVQNDPSVAAFGNLETIGGLCDVDVFARATGALRTGSDLEIFALDEVQGTDSTALVMRAPEFEANDPRFIVSLSAHAVAPMTLERLAKRFSLTNSEREVLGHLLSGKSADAISALRGVSLPTTRSQIQSILGKTGAPSQLALVRQCLLLGQQMAFLGLARDVGATGGSTALHAATDITLRDGRRMRFFDMGDRHGRPVLLLHALIGGSQLTQRQCEQARQRGWRFIAPLRPGFGASESSPARGMEMVRQIVDDLVFLLDTLGIDRCAVLGHLSSAGLALNFAARQPDRCKAVLNIGHPGLMDAQTINDMPNPSRTLARTHGLSETALRVLVRAFLASMDYFGPEQTVRKITRGAAPDQALLDDAEIKSILAQGLDDCTAHGVDTFIKDSFLTLHNFAEEVEALNGSVPLRCLVGEFAPNLSVQNARRLTRAYAHYRTESVKGCGQFVVFSAWDHVLGVLDALWAHHVPRQDACEAQASLGS